MVTKETKKEPDVLCASCPSRRVLELISDKWTLLVIGALANEVKRNNQLLREVEGISQKMLTQTLRKLEKNGIVSRQVYPVVPPMVEYSLTKLGKALLRPIRALGSWAEAHFEDVELSRKHYSRSLSEDQYEHLLPYRTWS